ncbi:MAG: chemotaxis protein CheB [Gammaproteobacteria bacterium]
MPEVADPPLRVALVSRSSRQCQSLTTILTSNGFEVIGEDVLKARMSQRLDREVADVLLLDLDQVGDESEDVVEQWLEAADVPILFNDVPAPRTDSGVSGAAWGRRLAGKLLDLARPEPEHAPEPVVLDAPAPGVVLAESSHADGIEFEIFAEDLDVAVLQDEDELVMDLAGVDQKQCRPTVAPAADVQAGTRQVWVLGASIGGPQAVKQFVSSLPGDLPITLVLAQHIGAGFVELLAAQLRRVANLEVSAAEDGQTLRHGQLVVAPVEHRMVITEEGRVELQPIAERSVYSPSIDTVMADVAARYGANSGAIVFSGMGNDGVLGCQAIVERGGTVWAQDAASCVISSMADAVREAGLASHSGDPGELAASLVEHVKRSTT